MHHNRAAPGGIVHALFLHSLYYKCCRSCYNSQQRKSLTRENICKGSIICRFFERAKPCSYPDEDKHQHGRTNGFSEV